MNMITAAETVLKIAAEGAVRLPVDHQFAFAEAAAAHELVESRRSHGKVLLWVSEER